MRCKERVGIEMMMALDQGAPDDGKQDRGDDELRKVAQRRRLEFAALDPAIGQLERHFDGADPTVRAGLARLREIAGLDIAPALPSLARSADALGLALREEKAL